ncbi:MAG: RES family NAD+ phosphorylase [Bacteroidetes bacterium]|nr:RES family NAD+ phosphorylase [Bacteroidota bacterium]
MDLFKIAEAKFAFSLNASGKANRWNKPGEFVIYASQSRALATLEMVARRSMIMPGKLDYKMMVIQVEDSASVQEISQAQLPASWNALSKYPTLQELGSGWYQSQNTLLLKVPSAIIPEEFNFVINTLHPEFESRLKLIQTSDYFWDQRLL